MNTVAVYDKTGNKVHEVSLAIREVEAFSEVAYACSIRRLMQNWRQGTVGCKTRGEVALSNRKPFKQKGTGRARAGTFRSPLWRKGGVIFGPQPRVRSLAISRRQRQLALAAACNEIVANDALLVAQVVFEKPSTKDAIALLRNLGIYNEKVVLFLTNLDEMTYRSFCNIPNVLIVFIDQINAYDLTNGSRWLVLEKDLEDFNAHIAKWS